MADETLDLFKTPEPPRQPAGVIDLPTYRQQLAQLADRGMYVGTSSWKYPGWCGMVYDEQRYLTNRKFSNAKFEATFLAEYAETYRTVCVDAGYYKFPTIGYLTELCAQVPEGFKFAFKATDETTIKNFPGLPRFGNRRGRRVCVQLARGRSVSRHRPTRWMRQTAPNGSVFSSSSMARRLVRSPSPSISRSVAEGSSSASRRPLMALRVTMTHAATGAALSKQWLIRPTMRRVFMCEKFSEFTGC
jgi:hypothetical protein